MLNFKEQINQLITSDQNVIEIVTFEWQRLYKSIQRSCEDLQRQFLIYSPTSGLKIFGSNLDISVLYQDVETNTFNDVLTFFHNELKNATLLIEDAEQFLDKKNFDNIRFIKEIAKDIKSKPKYDNKTLILSTTSECIPESLSKEISVLHINYATRDEIKDLFDELVKTIKLDYPKAKIFYEEEIGEALLGLSTSEINHILRKILNEQGNITKNELPCFLNEKVKAIASNALLDLITPNVTLNDVGGLNNLKYYIKHRKLAFSNKASKLGLPLPKGIMLLGVPGCGKSLVAKAIASEWNYPLIKLDFGRLYHRYLGDSESNLRQAIAVAEAMSPCVLWVDEIEKGLAGAGRSDDNGVASRLFGTFLTWMQEKSHPVFIVATANHISQIPTELFRKGRFDEIFFLDLPTLSERESIIAIHLAKKGELGNDINVNELASISEGFNGAEIECAINDALFTTLDKGEEKLTQPRLLASFKETYPLSRSMSESIETIRMWGAKTIKPAR